MVEGPPPEGVGGPTGEGAEAPPAVGDSAGLNQLEEESVLKVHGLIEKINLTMREELSPTVDLEECHYLEVISDGSLSTFKLN